MNFKALLSANNEKDWMLNSFQIAHDRIQKISTISTNTE
jgi:hypothetical protein